MTTDTNGGLYGVGAEELKQNWLWFLVLGIILDVLGLFALTWAVVATIASVVIFGWLLLIGGVLSVAHAFLRRRWGGFFLDLVAGLLYLVVGLMFIANPVAEAIVLTLLLALVLIIGGLFRIVTAVSVRFHHWGWMLLNGVISLLLGILIWQQWPAASLWVIGLFVGIDLIFYGLSLMMLGLMAKGMNTPA